MAHPAGASKPRGIGAAISKALAATGADVVLTYAGSSSVTGTSLLVDSGTNA